jgi:hypothetical protein
VTPEAVVGDSAGDSAGATAAPVSSKNRKSILRRQEREVLTDMKKSILIASVLISLLSFVLEGGINRHEEI